MALPKPYRLRERKEFDRVYRRGKRCGGKALLLRIASQPRRLPQHPAQPQSQLTSPDARPAKPIKASERTAAHDAPPSRMAVVVSTKVHKRAVVRNRVRRQIQAAFQTLIPQLKPGKLLVITVKASAVECDYYEFLQQLEQLLIKAEAIHGH